MSFPKGILSSSLRFWQLRFARFGEDRFISLLPCIQTAGVAPGENSDKNAETLEDCHPAKPGEGERMHVVLQTGALQ